MELKKSQILPTIEEFKQNAKELKDNNTYEKLGHAQNALAVKYGYKNYRAIKSHLKTNTSLPEGLQILTADQMYAMMKNEALANNNPTINFKDENYFNNQTNIIEGIPIDPILPENFWDTDNNERERVELEEWWDKPFIQIEEFSTADANYEEYSIRMKSYYENDDTYKLESKDVYMKRIEDDKISWFNHWTTGKRYDVYVLDGGAWDRPTSKGKVDTLEEALSIAKVEGIK